MTDPDYGMALRRIADESVIVRIANQLDHHVDSKDWARARALFADRITVTFAEKGKGEPRAMKADELIGMWRANLGAKKTSHHLRGNHIVHVDGDHASVISNAYAWNRLEGNGDSMWEVWGHYRYELERSGPAWRITVFEFNATHERGNQWVKTTPAPD
jgi:hypothetical protein